MSKVARINEIDAISADPSFWLDVQKAQGVMREHGELKATVDAFSKMGESLREALEYLETMGSEAQDLVEDILTSVGDQLETWETERMLCDPYDSHSAFVSINSGAGGTDSQDWCAMLFRMYERFAVRHGWEVEALDFQPGTTAGFKSVDLHIKGRNAYGYFKAEAGVHRIIRISPFGAGRRETSFAAVRVSPEVDDAITVEVAEKDVRKDTYRSSGAGGQHVNKTDSAIRLTHIPTGVVVQCQTQRSQPQNLALAWKMLRAKLYQMEVAKREQEAGIQHGNEQDNAFGSQIRTYVFHPSQMVKDHRTGVETYDITKVMNGDLDPFIHSVLLSKV